MEKRKESYITTTESVNSLQHVSLLSSGLTVNEQIKLYCKPTYRLRRVKNKGAILVIAWSYLITSTIPFVLASEGYTGLLTKLGLVAVGLTLPVAGWLSDVYFGRYKVIRCSMYIVWIALILATASSVVAQLVEGYEYIINYVYGTLMIIAVVGVGGFQANLIQFGIDQLHDASTNEITSFIIWYVWTYFASGYLLQCALICSPKGYWIIGKLVICINASIVLVSMFLLNHLLVKEPVTQNPFKLVYSVIKYAIKNKHPRCRSAFTYCEDDLPSRIDFGKRKYGGPFTTEQVEDVKTLFRVLVIVALGSVSFGATFGSSILLSKLSNKLMVNATYSTDSECYLREAFTDTFDYSSAIVIPLYEFFLYPVLYQCLRTFESQKKLTLGVIMHIATTLTCVVLDIVNQHAQSENSITTSISIMDNRTLSIPLNYRWTAIPYFLRSTSNALFAIGSVEFIASQVPYLMRGLIIGACYGMVFLSALVIIAISIPFTKKLSIWGTGIISSGFWHGLLQLAIDIVVGIMLVVALKWYKKRKRDDVLPNEHIFAERYYGGRDK